MMHAIRHQKSNLAKILGTLAAFALAGCSPGVGSIEPSGDVPEAVGWRTEVVANGLTHPWSITWLPDGSALITERAGRLRLLNDGRLDPSPIAGVPAICADCGQGGLLDVSLHPDFADNRLVYLTYAAGTADANRTTLARGRLDGLRLTDVEVIFENANPKSGGQHFGSRLVWRPDRTLLMSVGDGGNPPTSFNGDDIRKQAQLLGTHFGKVVRLRDDGSAPPDNPFVGRPGARPEIFSYGHRNIQGMVRDPASGYVWANEHGSRGGDELNKIAAAKNYGWPEVTYSMEYWGPRISDETQRPDVAEPIVVWTPSKAPSGLALYTGDEFPAWRGDLFSGALKFKQVRRLNLESGRVVGQEKLSIGKRVRDVRQGPDGGLYLLTDEADGELLRIVKD
ncbi:MAG: PQQ-dependent sugar dehydrogenase [Thiohalocapsa sp.]